MWSERRHHERSEKDGTDEQYCSHKMDGLYQCIYISNVYPFFLSEFLYSSVS